MNLENRPPSNPSGDLTESLCLVYRWDFLINFKKSWKHFEGHLRSIPPLPAVANRVYWWDPLPCTRVNVRAICDCPLGLPLLVPLIHKKLWPEPGQVTGRQTWSPHLPRGEAVACLMCFHGGWRLFLALSGCPLPCVDQRGTVWATGNFFSHFGYHSFNLGNSVILSGSLPDLPCHYLLCLVVGQCFSSLGIVILPSCLIMPGSRVDAHLLSAFPLPVFTHGVLFPCVLGYLWVLDPMFEKLLAKRIWSLVGCCVPLKRI